jgi:hypothetical protein
MVIILKNNKAFIHIPKTGGSSVSAVLAKMLGKQGVVPKDGEDRPGWQLRLHSGHMHGSYAEAIKYLRKHEPFAVVRHPMDRALSFYTASMREPKKNGGSPASLRLRHAVLECGSFKEFVRWIAGGAAKDYPLFRPMWDYLSLNGEQRVHNILRFERLQDEWMHYARKNLGMLNPPRLPRKNTSEHDDYRSYYDTETVELLRELWPEDWERLGYAAPALV